MQRRSVVTDLNDDNRLIACHECAAVYRRLSIPQNAHASCRRCDSELFRHIPDSLTKSLALYLTALMLWTMANLYPFLELKVGGIEQQNLLLAGGLALYKHGMGELGLVVFLTSIAFPFLNILGMLYLLVSVAMGKRPPLMGHIYQFVKALEPWSLIGVFMLGTLIAIVKLQDLATVIPGLSLFAFAALLVIYSMARANFDPEDLWSAASSHALYAHEVTEVLAIACRY